jgi:hypothetical protein
MVTPPLDRDGPTGGRRQGRRRSRLDVSENQVLFSFVSKTGQLIFVFAPKPV